MSRRAAYRQLIADPRTWRSRGEAAAQLLTGAIAEPVAGAAGLAGFVTGGVDNGVSSIEAMRRAMTYQPRDPSSAEALAAMVQPVGSALERVKRGLGDPVAARLGPAAGTAAYMIPDTLMAVLGARAMPKGGPTMGQMAENISQPRRLHPQTGAIVWHGSPHRFDEFRAMDNIGAGHGAQAYGHGGYVSEAQEVAKSYSGRLSNELSYNGRPMNRDSAKGTRDAAAWALYLADGDKAVAKSSGLATPDAIDRLNPAKLQPGGQLYKMDIPDEAVGKMLDWDAPILEQPEVMRALASHPDHESFRGYASDAELWPDKSDWMTGAQLYSQLDELYGGKRSILDNGGSGAAARVLEEAGIPGIRYMDGKSLDAGVKNNNYVTFSDSLVRILERNGVPTGQQPWKPGEWK